MDIAKTIKEYRLVIISITIFVITAICSQGFMHPDEHFQILELLNVKFSGPYQDATIFNWDYDLRMRSWFQPFLYYLTFFSIKNINPYLLAAMVRALNGLIALWAIGILVKTLLPDNWKKTLLLVSCTWFIPYLMVRTSSESLATSVFILGNCLSLRGKHKMAALSFGITFLIRFQMAVLIAPLMIISLIYKKTDLKTFAGMLVIIFSTIGIGVIIDFWGYGNWTFSFYNYLYYNLVEGRSKEFGVEPIYFFLIKPLIKGIPLITIPILIGFAKSTVKKNHLVLLYSLLVFLVVNSLIAHKEVRFLTPVYVLIAIYSISEMCSNKKWSKFLTVYIFINLIIMIKTSLMPAHSRIDLYNEVYKRNLSKIYTIKRENMFSFTMPFYMKRNIVVLPEETIGPISNYTLLSTNHKQFVAISNRTNCRLDFSQYPTWVKHINVTDWLSRSSYYSLWKCSKNITDNRN